MRFLVFNADAERRDGLKTLLRQIDRRATCGDAADRLQVEGLLHRYEFDLALADWHDVRRLGELAALCEQCRPTPLALMIDSASPDVARKLYAVGVRGIVPRTMPVALIVRALEIVLLGGIYVPPGALAFEHMPEGQTSERGARFTQWLAQTRRSPRSPLSERQLQIMRCVHMGCTNKMIAKSLGISEGTVKIHLSSIFQQLGARNRAAAVAIYNGWLRPQLEVLFSEKESSPKPILGAPCPIPLRPGRRSGQTYPARSEQIHEPLPLAAEPGAHYQASRSRKAHTR
jgi:DNA-binding NarL/FixJ family response regulator